MVLIWLSILIAAMHTTGVVAKQWDQLYLTFGVYNSIPLSAEELLKDNYTVVYRDEELIVNMYIHQDDVRVLIAVDDLGNVVGVRINLIISDIEKTAQDNNLTFPINYANHPMFTYGTILSTEVYYTTVMFRDPAVASPEAYPGVLNVEGLYTRLDDQWTLVPENRCDALNQGFVKEGCVPAMGGHNAYKVSTDVDCADFQGVFPLYIEGSLIGTGIAAFASQNKGTSKTWFERPTSAIVPLVVPYDAPACLADWSDKFGLTTLHIYFTSDPANITCPETDTECSLT